MMELVQGIYLVPLMYPLFSFLRVVTIATGILP